VPYGAPVDETTVARVVASLWQQSDGVWLVLTPDAQRNDPHGRVSAWLSGDATAVETWQFGENVLHFYARTPGRADTIRDLSSESRMMNSEFAAQVLLSRYLVGDTAHLFLYWDSPPDGSVSVRLLPGTGETPQKEITAPAPAPATNGPTRQHVALPLTADLAAGDYHILVQVGDGQVEAGRFKLLHRGSAGTIRPDDIQHSLDLNLGEHIRLLGYDLPRTVAQPGGVVELTLYWQALEPITARYKVFTHLLGETYNAATDNFLWGQQDNEPLNAQLPTTVWVPGAIVADSYNIPVAADAPSGQYSIELGMYGLVDGARLPVLANGAVVGDHVLLPPIEIKAQ
jgi:hypothetical protein